MSDTSQGPGWWLASDGRWYPPEQHPGGQLPPPSPYAAPHEWPTVATHGAGDPMPTVPRTSGRATASLVCSIGGFLFLGLPAVVGVILGFVARGEIRRSNGTRTGMGLALAGIIVGLVEIALVVILAVIVVVAVVHRQNSVAVPGEPGYRTFTGADGRPMAPGRPWGEACQPVVFQTATGMPHGVYEQLESVVSAARTRGVDVTVATPQDQWIPSQLYPPGLTNTSVKFVTLFPQRAEPPVLDLAGHREHIEFEWDTRPSMDGKHDVVTYLQVDLYLKAVPSPASQRLALRQLVAFTQGVSGSTAPGSGIASGSTVDAFSAKDIAAMQRMSGCNYEAHATTP